ncbi:MAG: D-aminoacyl-tRNA deacylase [Anaerolineales bacterium]
MKAVVQLVKKGSVRVEGEVISKISRGVVVLLGVGPEDEERNARELAETIAKLRILPDRDGKMNLSLLDVGAEALVVPQFTLYADTSKGNRPSFTDAAPPSLARPLVDHFVRELSAWGVPTKSGQFGAHMLVEIHNDGPVTITLES